MSKDNTNIIKGIFVLLVFLSHSSQYIGYENLLGFFDASYISVQKFLGQMIVSVFLFYSGYGIMESITKKGFSYVKLIPLKRILKTLVGFDIVVVLYLLIDLLLGEPLSISKTLLSFLAWDNINNSNWYILLILLLYAASFLSFIPIRLSKAKYIHVICAIILTIFAAFIALFLREMGKDYYYYYTVFIFPLGIWYSILKPYIDKLVMKNDYIYFCILTIVTLAFAFANIHRTDKVYIASFYHTITLTYIAWSLIFTIFIVLLTMKLKTNSVAFSWLGEHLFAVYILQRIPMLILDRIGFSTKHPYFFIIISFVATIFLALVFDFLMKKLWSKLKI